MSNQSQIDYELIRAGVRELVRERVAQLRGLYERGKVQEFDLVRTSIYREITELAEEFKVGIEDLKREKETLERKMDRLRGT